MNTLTTGRSAEQLACRFLQVQGLQYIDHNFNRRIGELDLIMFDHKADSWVLVEVRYRSRHRYGNPAVSVDARKQRKLVRATRAFLQQQSPSLQTARIDVIAIAPIDKDAIDEHQNTLYGRVTTTFENHQIDWFINAIGG